MSLLLLIAMPFLGIRIGVPMLSGGGNTTPPPAVVAGSFYQIFFH